MLYKKFIPFYFYHHLRWLSALVDIDRVSFWYVMTSWKKLAKQGKMFIYCSVQIRKMRVSINGRVMWWRKHLFLVSLFSSLMPHAHSGTTFTIKRYYIIKWINPFFCLTRNIHSSRDVWKAMRIPYTISAYLL